MSFVHLHTHTHFSLFEGTIKIEELALKAAELQMPACAITDFFRRTFSNFSDLQ